MTGALVLFFFAGTIAGRLVSRFEAFLRDPSLDRLAMALGLRRLETDTALMRRMRKALRPLVCEPTASAEAALVAFVDEYSPAGVRKTEWLAELARRVFE